jgi:hypothetical protein
MDSEPIEIELLGVARLLARQQTVSLAMAAPVRLSELVAALLQQTPALAGTVIAEDGTLVGGHVFARGGRDLLREPGAPIMPGERLQLLSVEEGG